MQDTDVCSNNAGRLDEICFLKTREMEGVLRTREVFGKNREGKLRNIFWNAVRINF